jgi:predicted 3-demethylubiquinone-9 3-methyltransferase (glyoxalase superfamily)
MTQLIPCLWFDGQAEQAAEFYASVLPDTQVDKVHRAAADFPSGKKGDPLTVEFTLVGQPMVGLNGGPDFQFNEAISFQVMCDNQEDVDRYWKALSSVPENEQCGWCKDKFGLSWQIIPRRLTEMLSHPDRQAAERAMQAMLGMKKLRIAELETAFHSE